jgi:hypothetical protein
LEVASHQSFGDLAETKLIQTASESFKKKHCFPAGSSKKYGNQ